MLYIKYEKLDEIADELSLSKKELDKCIKDMSLSIKHMSEVWGSELSEKYLEEYHEKEICLKDTSELLQRMSETLKKLNEYCTLLEKKNTAQP